MPEDIVFSTGKTSRCRRGSSPGAQETWVEADFNRPSSRRTASWVLGFENGDGAVLLYGKPVEPLAQNLPERGDRVFLV